ncbi:MAG: hypothetical protein NTV43_00395 [Methylococcales bacterium]|nr:hypothetical protein [Methylococcales bacterium]
MNDQVIEIEHYGDANAFTVGPSFVDFHGAFEGVIVEHPAAALRLASSFLIGEFENTIRNENGTQTTEAINLKAKPPTVSQS